MVDLDKLWSNYGLKGLKTAATATTAAAATAAAAAIALEKGKIITYQYNYHTVEASTCCLTG